MDDRVSGRAAAALLRPARTEEAGPLTDLAHAAKRHWGYPAAWIDAWRDALTVTPAFIEANLVVVAEVAGTRAGFYALSVEEAEASLEHCWVHPYWMGRGIGRRLVRHAAQAAAEAGARDLIIESDPYAAGFYRRLGAEPAGQVRADVLGQRRELPRLRLALPMAEG